jgi:hypothetical protein
VPATAFSRAATAVVESVGASPGTGELPEPLWERRGPAPDPRSRQGRIYPLPCLVAIAVCAMTAAGHDSLDAIGQWIARAGQDDLARLRVPADPLTGVHPAPDESTVRRLLAGSTLGR